MLLLSRRSVLGIAATVDIALHARHGPVAAKSLAARLVLPPRHLETLLQALVRSGILKGMRGPRGGYELARERRRITAGDIVRSAMASDADEETSTASTLVAGIIEPALREAGASFLAKLDTVTVDELCRAAEARSISATGSPATVDFTI